MLSTISLLLMSRHSIPIIQCNRLFRSQTHTSHFHSNLSTKSMRFRSILCNFPLPFLFTPHHLLSAHPSVVSFSLDVFHSLPSNHTSQNSASITQIIVSFATTIITSTFAQKCHSFSHFDFTSTRLHSAIIY